MKSADYLIWLDLEMSGLDPACHVILQIGCVVTDNQLNIVAEGPVYAIHQSEEALASIDPWCIKQHGDSGLLRQVAESTMTVAEAEGRTLDFLKEHCAAKKSPLCGNSIGQDRRFLDRYMPQLNAFFHYRNIDVSTVKELVHRWYPVRLQAPEKKKTHHVLEDIRESIEELKHYRRTVFK